MLLINPTVNLAILQGSSGGTVQQYENGFIRPLTEKEGYLLALYRETLQNGLQYRDFELLVRIAQAESNIRQFAKDGSVLRGRQNPMDVGIFQINEKYHLSDSQKIGYNIYEPEGNIKFAVELYSREGTRPWNWSKGKWSKQKTIDTSRY